MINPSMFCNTSQDDQVSSPSDISTEDLSVDRFRDNASKYCFLDSDFCNFFSDFKSFCLSSGVLTLCSTLEELAEFFAKDSDMSYEESLSYLQRTGSYGFTAQKEEKIYTLNDINGIHGGHHELSHLLSAPGGKTDVFSSISANMMEGITEFFTRKYEESLGSDMSYSEAYLVTYPSQHNFVNMIVTRCGYDVEREFFKVHYCRGNCDDLIEAILHVWQSNTEKGKLKPAHKKPLDHQRAKVFMKKYLSETSSSMSGGVCNELMLRSFTSRFPESKELPSASGYKPNVEKTLSSDELDSLASSGEDEVDAALLQKEYIDFARGMSEFLGME